MFPKTSTIRSFGAPSSAPHELASQRLAKESKAPLHKGEAEKSTRGKTGPLRRTESLSDAMRPPKASRVGGHNRRTIAFASFPKLLFVLLTMINFIRDQAVILLSEGWARVLRLAASVMGFLGYADAHERHRQLRNAEQAIEEAYEETQNQPAEIDLLRHFVGFTMRQVKDQRQNIENLRGWPTKLIVSQKEDIDALHDALSILETRRDTLVHEEVERTRAQWRQDVENTLADIAAGEETEAEAMLTLSGLEQIAESSILFTSAEKEKIIARIKSARAGSSSSTAKTPLE